jgi:hypothetical protein
MADQLQFGNYVYPLDRDRLTPIVRRALDNPALEVTSWEWTDVSGTGNGYGNSAVYRIAGKCNDLYETRDWSLILKMMREQSSETPTSSHYWKREFEAYQSDWLNNLPSNSLTAPRCYHAEWRPGEPAQLWLEDMAAAAPALSQEKLVIAARHVGQFNGIYLVKERPPYDWFSRHFIQQDIAKASAFLRRLEIAETHPNLRRFWHPKRRDELRRLYQERETFFAALDRLPTTILHLDAFSRNLFMRHADGQDQTIAIDWAFTGIEAIGAELASLMLVSMIFADVPPMRAREFEQQAFAAYLDGLRDVGWQGDVQQVRLGVSASLALRHFGFALGMGFVLEDEKACAKMEADSKISTDEVIDQFTVLGEFVDTLAAEARMLINQGH